MNNIFKAGGTKGTKEDTEVHKGFAVMRNSILVIVLVGTSCSSTSSSSIQNTSLQSRQQALEKISFDISEIDENGLIGPADGKRSVSYEFCIPIDRKKRREVAAIDPSVRFFDGPKGRIGCHDQYLCLGGGGTQEVLLRLAGLEYIKKIAPFYGE